MRNRIIGAIAAIAAAAVIAACGGGSSTHTSLTAKVKCGVSISQWYKHGGNKDVTILRSQFKPLLTATESHQRGAIKRDAAGVEAAANTLKSHEPPNCVPNADADLTSALTAVSGAAAAATAEDEHGVKRELKQADDSLKNIVTDVRNYVKN